MRALPRILLAAGFAVGIAQACAACAWLKPACTVIRAADRACTVIELSDGTRVPVEPAELEAFGEAKLASMAHRDAGAP